MVILPAGGVVVPGIAGDPHPVALQLLNKLTCLGCHSLQINT